MPVKNKMVKEPKVIELSETNVAKVRKSSADKTKVKTIVNIILMALYIRDDNGKTSGRTSGNVYMRNGRTRAMAFFAKSITPAALFVKSNFQFLTANFKALNVDEIAAWNAYSFGKSDRFARKINIAGKAAYIALNQNLAQIGASAITLPPTLEDGNPAPTILDTITATATLPTLTIGYETNVQGSKTELFATKQLSPAITKPGQSQFRIISIFDTTAAGPFNALPDYTAKFGTLVTGSKIFFQTKVIDPTTGLPSLIDSGFIIVAP